MALVPVMSERKPPRNATVGARPGGGRISDGVAVGPRQSLHFGVIVHAILPATATNPLPSSRACSDAPANRSDPRRRRPRARHARRGAGRDRGRRLGHRRLAGRRPGARPAAAARHASRAAREPPSAVGAAHLAAQARRQPARRPRVADPGALARHGVGGARARPPARDQVDRHAALAVHRQKPGRAASSSAARCAPMR